MQKQKIVQKIDPDILQFLKGRKEVPVNTMIILINIVVFFLMENIWFNGVRHIHH